MKLRDGSVVVGLVVLVLVAGLSPARAHSPTVDADLSDWCLFTTPRVEDSSATLICALGTEVVWWDAPADGAVNDLATVATTQDAGTLYWAGELHVDPDPISLPFAEIAIDVAPGGNSTWWDPLGRLKEPGHCSVDTHRLCTVDDDCHFCTHSTIYTGTPNERPRPCGSTNAIDSCDDFDNTDLCIREQTCVGLAEGDPAGGVGQGAAPVIQPDYLLVLDFSRWLVNFCDAVKLLRADNGAWVEIPRQNPDPNCQLPTWHFLPAVDPGTSGGTGGPPGKFELAVPWEAFVCDGCEPFGPGDSFRWNVEVNRGALNVDYLPDLAIEDVMSEVVAGSTTTTSDSCPGPGTDTTLCEIADGTMDAFVPRALPGLAGGRTGGLMIEKDSPTMLTLSWGPSCSLEDDDYEVYEGTIGNWTSHVQPASGAICSTGGATSVSLTAAAASSYYLVVPTDGATEGSYGTDSTGTERPASTNACRPQTVNACP